MSTPDRVVLNSWKEIANYLDRGIRTVQRWENKLALPVHRLGPGKRNPVFAFPSELLNWLQEIAENDRRRTQSVVGGLDAPQGSNSGGTCSGGARA